MAWLEPSARRPRTESYPIVINARIDVFVGSFLSGAAAGSQADLVPDALRRANAYLEAGADCVYPIVLQEADALRRFTSEVRGPVNAIKLPQGPSLSELTALGVARVSWGAFLHHDATGALRTAARLAPGMTPPRRAIGHGAAR